MRIPKEVTIVLQEYITLLNEYFPETIGGLYLHGSIALDAYEHHLSDIDFITITNRRFTENEMDHLTEVHSILEEKYNKPELDGVYMIWDDLGKLYSHSSDFHPKYIFYNDGNLAYGDYFNFNPITWWTLKYKGIKVLGKEVEDLTIDFQPDSLTTYVHKNMNSYWVHYINKTKAELENFSTLSSDKINEAIEWSVLGLLRQYYTLREKGIISKSAAGSYGLQHLPKEWHPIIQEAINIRSGIFGSVFSSERERISTALNFCSWLIQHCNGDIIVT